MQTAEKRDFLENFQNFDIINELISGDSFGEISLYMTGKR